MYVRVCKGHGTDLMGWWAPTDFAEFLICCRSSGVGQKLTLRKTPRSARLTAIDREKSRVRSLIRYVKIHITGKA